MFGFALKKKINTKINNNNNKSIPQKQKWIKYQKKFCLEREIVTNQMCDKKEMKKSRDGSKFSINFNQDFSYVEHL